jgi:KRAB domain-containing zinc finger protein
MQKICLIAHMHKYHLAKNDNECPDCHKKFDAYIKLRRHLRVHYKSIHRCDICHKIFENRMELREHFDHHLARKQGIKCYFRGCNQFFGSVKKANSHYKKHTSMVICPLCGKTCSDKGVLTSHLARHEANGDSRQNMYQCDLCTHKFEEKSWLEIHMNYKHLQSNEYKCPVCQDKFPTHSRLIIHVKRHTMQFKCDICEKEFSQQSGLITHRKFHFSTDIFECDFPNCNKSYNRKECLSRHKLNHENVKRHKCQICGMKFVLKQ